MKTEFLRRLVKFNYKRENNQLHKHLSTAGRKSLKFDHTATVKYPNITLTLINYSIFPHVPFISFLLFYLVLYFHFQNITEFSTN